MLTPVPPSECVRAREAVSGRLDGELSEFDCARLDAHLHRCADCRAFEAEAEALATVLRRAPLEPLAAPAFARRRRRRRTVVPRLQAAAAVLVAAAAGSSFALGHMLGSRSTPPQPLPVGSDLQSLRADSTEQHMLAMLSQLEPFRSRHFGTTVAL